MTSSAQRVEDAQAQFRVHHNEDIHLVQNRRGPFSPTPRSPYVPGLSDESGRQETHSFQRGINNATNRHPRNDSGPVTQWSTERPDSDYPYQHSIKNQQRERPRRKGRSTFSIEGPLIGAAWPQSKKLPSEAIETHHGFEGNQTRRHQARIVSTANIEPETVDFISRDHTSPYDVADSAAPATQEVGSSTPPDDSSFDVSLRAVSLSFPHKSLTSSNVHGVSSRASSAASIDVVLPRSNIKATKSSHTTITAAPRSLNVRTAAGESHETLRLNSGLVSPSHEGRVRTTLAGVERSGASETTVSKKKSCTPIVSSAKSRRDESYSAESATTVAHSPSTASASLDTMGKLASEDAEGTLYVLGSIDMPPPGIEEALRLERKNRRAAATVALNEAQDALRSPDASVEYLIILQGKLTRYLCELAQTELEYRQFVKKDQLEIELQNQRTLQDRGTETTCRLRLKIESIRRDRCLSSGSKEDTEFDKLVRLLELSPAGLPAVVDHGKARRRKETNKSYDKESLTKDHVEREVRRGHIPEPRKTQVVPSTVELDNAKDNIDDERFRSAGIHPRPPTQTLHELSRDSCSDCFKLFARDFTRCCDNVYDFSMGTQNAKMLTGGGRFVKYALFLANLVILLGGIVVFAVGVWALVDSSFMERLIGSDQFATSAATLMASGCIVVVVSLLGCLGAFKEIRCLLMVYFILLLIVFVTMVVGGVVGYVFRGDVDESVYRAMWTSIPLYSNDTAVTRAWDEIQRNFKCCGMRNKNNLQDPPKDAWRRNKNYNNNNIKVPDSCCIRVEWLGGCRKNPTSRDTFMADCHMKVRDFIKSHALALGAVGIAVACLVLLGMALSCALIIIIR